MNHLSKTHIPCDCGWLSGALNEPESPVVYDAKQNLFLIVTPLKTTFVLYHCPFCGGAFPDAGKPIWVPIVGPEELNRLNALVSKMTSRDILLKELGPPDYTSRPNGSENFSVFEYYGIADVAYLECFVDDDGPVTCKIQIKSVSPRHL